MRQGVTYRSKIAYLHLATVVVLGVLITLALSAPIGAIVGAVGLGWVLLTWRSGIEVTTDGFKVRGLVRTRKLDWSQTDAFIVIGYSGDTAYFGSASAGGPYGGVATGNVGSPPELTSLALANREHLFSLVAVVTSHGDRIKVPGTASSFLETTFPARAAAELNNTLKLHNPAATAS